MALPITHITLLYHSNLSDFNTFYYFLYNMWFTTSGNKHNYNTISSFLLLIKRQLILYLILNVFLLATFKLFLKTVPKPHLTSHIFLQHLQYLNAEEGKYLKTTKKKKYGSWQAMKASLPHIIYSLLNNEKFLWKTWVVLIIMIVCKSNEALMATFAVFAYSFQSLSLAVFHYLFSMMYLIKGFSQKKYFSVPKLMLFPQKYVCMRQHPKLVLKSKTIFREAWDKKVTIKHRLNWMG